MVYLGTFNAYETFNACGDGIFWMGTFNACGDGTTWNI